MLYGVKPNYDHIIIFQMYMLYSQSQDQPQCILILEPLYVFSRVIHIGKRVGEFMFWSEDGFYITRCNLLGKSFPFW